MVAAAKIERDATEKKNDQLRSQIRDTELLLASHQEQLADLKTVMQGMGPSSEPDTRHGFSSGLASPDSPHRPPLIVASSRDSTGSHAGILDTDELSPGPSTSFTQFIKPVCRTDLPAYNDFHDLFVQPTNSKPPSRSTSGSSYSNVISSLTGGPSPNERSSTPTGNTRIHLKDTRFYKRTLMEDIEPTLRLDTSSGISWLARRNVMSSICDGSLIVEPVPEVEQISFPCSICGERRDDVDSKRTHRFRTSDNESAQRYPLCVLCVKRVRSCCEFTSFLRLILDGHVRCEDEQDEKDAWEETIRLRETMFWSRVGAGVIPLFPQINSQRALEQSNEASQANLPESGLHLSDQQMLSEDSTAQPESSMLTPSAGSFLSANSEASSIGDGGAEEARVEGQDTVETDGAHFEESKEQVQDSVAAEGALEESKEQVQDSVATEGGTLEESKEQTQDSVATDDGAHLEESKEQQDSVATDEGDQTVDATSSNSTAKVDEENRADDEASPSEQNDSSSTDEASEEERTDIDEASSNEQNDQKSADKASEDSADDDETSSDEDVTHEASETKPDINEASSGNEEKDLNSAHEASKEERTDVDAETLSHEQTEDQKSSSL